MDTVSALTRTKRPDVKARRQRPWNPPRLDLTGFDLAIEWEGEAGPEIVHFDSTGSLDLWHDGSSAKGASWVAPLFGLKIIATIDNTHHGRLLHVSVSHGRVLPPWPVMIAVKRHFFPNDVAAAMVMPEEAVYVNVHARCLHIWQMPVEWGIG